MIIETIDITILLLVICAAKLTMITSALIEVIGAMRIFLLKRIGYLYSIQNRRNDDDDNYGIACDDDDDYLSFLLRLPNFIPTSRFPHTIINLTRPKLLCDP